MRVLFLTLYPETLPSSRLRVYQYLPALAQCGIQTKVLPAVPEPWFSRFYFSKYRFLHALYSVVEIILAVGRIRQARYFDAVFVQKGIVSTNFKGLAARLLRETGRVFFDLDDHVLGQTISEFRHPWLHALQDARETEFIAAASVCVIAGNEHLRDRVLPLNAQSVVIPTPVDTDRFCPAAGAKVVGREIVLGWIGMEGGLAYLQSLKPVLQEVARRYPVCLKIISRMSSGESLKIDGIKTRFVRWSYETEVQEMQEFDLGLMPVPEDEWGQGKCGLKLLQYMAMGIASVASRVGANRAIVSENVDACLASTPAEWIEKICSLIESLDKREAMGLAARSKVLARYSLKALAPQFVRILKGEKDS